MLCKSKFTIRGNTPFQLYLLKSVAIKNVLKLFDFYNVKIFREMKSKVMETSIEYPKGNMYWFISFRQYINTNVITKDDTYKDDLNWLLDQIKKDIKKDYLKLENDLAFDPEFVVGTGLKYNLRFDQAYDLVTLRTKMRYNNNNGLLLSEQRVGKTRVAVALMEMTLCIGGVCVIVCPKSAQAGWLNELLGMLFYTKKNNYLISRVGAIKDIKNLKFDKSRINVRIVTYDIFKKLTSSQMKQIVSIDKSCIRMLIVDEAHRLRNFNTMQSQAIFDFKKLMKKYKIDLHTIGMSGTPAVKSSEDIFGMLSLINDSNIRLNPYINDFNEFKEYFYTCEDTSFGKKCKALKRESELNFLLKLCSVQTKQRDLDYFKNYTKEYKKIELKMDEYQKEIYDEVFENMEYEDKIDCQNRLVQHLRLQQICTDPSGLVASYELVAPKFKWILDFTNKQPNVKILVMSKRTQVLIHLQELLNEAKIGNRILKGEDRYDCRLKAIEDFKNNPEIRIFLIQQDAGREALTLPEARITIFLDRDFAQGYNEQAEARMTPVDGKPHKKYIVDLIMKDTIEELIYDKLVIRKESIESVNSIYGKEH